MKVLVGAEPEVVNKSTGGFVCTDQGELVKLWECPCDCDECPKSIFSGMESRRASLYARVAERSDLTPEIYSMMLLEDMRRGGWIDDIEDPEVVEYSITEAAFLTELVGELPVGSLITRTREHFLLAPSE